MRSSTLIVMVAAFTLMVPVAKAQGSGPVLLSTHSVLSSRECGFGPPSKDREPSLAVNRRRPGRRVVAYLQDGTGGIAVASTHNSGRSWSLNAVPGLTRCSEGPWDHVFHPRVAIGGDGTAYVASYVRDDTQDPTVATAPGRVAFSRSRTGRRWSRASFLEGANGDLLNDFDSIAADQDDSGGVSISWTPLEGADPFEPTYVSRSADGGRTWTHRVAYRAAPGTSAWSRLTALADGSLLLVLMEQPHVSTLGLPVPGTMKALRSADHGATWSTPVRLGEADVVQWPAVAEGRSRRVAAAWRLGGAIVHSRSADAGATWSAPAEVAPPDEPGLPGPGIAIAADGSVGVLHHVTRGDAADVVLSRSTEAGWTRTVLGTGGRLSDAGFYHDLAAIRCGFAAAFVQAAPAALQGPTDVFAAVAKSRVPPRRAGTRSRAGCAA